MVEWDSFSNLNDACLILELLRVSGDLHKALLLVQVCRFMAQRTFTVPALMLGLFIYRMKERTTVGAFALLGPLAGSTHTCRIDNGNDNRRSGQDVFASMP